MKTKALLFNSLLVTSLGLSAGSVFAQSGQAATQDEAKAKGRQNLVVEELLVTAERREQSIQKIASAVSLIGGDTIRDSEVRNAGDVIRFVPNMSADTTDGHGRPKFYIRGIGLSDASIWNINPIGTYNDDVYIWNASTVGFPTFDLERVEVLRGPQGTLWGKNTTGGAIHFISKKPTFDPDGYLKASYGNYNESLLEGAIGGALIEDKLAGRLSLFTQSSDRYVQNPLNPGTEDWRDSAGRLQLLSTFSDDFSANLNIHFRDFSGPVLSNGNRNNLTQTRFKVPSAVDRDDQLDQLGGSLTLKKEFASGINLTSVTAVEDFEREQFGGDAVPYESTRTHSRFTVDQFSQEVRLTSSDDQQLTWILGAYLFNGTLESEAQTGVIPGSLNASGATKAISYKTSNYESEAESYALFGNVSYQFTEKFKLAVGLRGTSDTSKVDLRARSANAGFTFGNVNQWWVADNIQGAFRTTAVQDEEKTWEAFTYDITPGYDVTDNFRVYFRHAKGYNGGNFNAAAEQQNLVQVIEPEYLKSYEAGFKSEWFDSQVIFNLATFYYDYTDIQQKATTLDDNNQQILTFINAGGGYSRGLEAELTWLPIDNLTVQFNLGYNNTKFTDFQESPTNNVRGNWFNRVPRVISNIQLSYQIPLRSGASIVLDTDWAYRSKSYFNATNQIDRALIEDPYTIGNVSVGYNSPSGKYTVRAYSANVTDEIYRNTSLITGMYSHGSPRTYGVSASVKFF
ncbi:TonB-dependent receptor [Cellvibrio polysaccharolyticus]|uniref:TonB-dependent receptor n=1 Tax=Cellvibrio polysaccharolyticus TaxID=2082724 RepID=A0A928UZ62_9GAMM|nr:TonB-dependent receptor [Cellvibrio polysaccharolyticus]MBE8715906.1 TonB-dependent receptor [Cellvibrio polysaccharolyticus]